MAFLIVVAIGEVAVVAVVAVLIMMDVLAGMMAVRRVVVVTARKVVVGMAFLVITGVPRGALSPQGFDVKT